MDRSRSPSDEKSTSDMKAGVEEKHNGNEISFHPHASNPTWLDVFFMANMKIPLMAHFDYMLWFGDVKTGHRADNQLDFWDQFYLC